MKKLPIGIQTFSELILKNYIYIDKTNVIHNLITQGKVYFLARPRRFGKSLLISTLQAVLEGKRELFKGLAIDKLDYDWTARPVVRIDFSGINRDTPEKFVADLRTYLINEANQYNILVDQYAPPSSIFRTLVSGIYAQHGPVALLVDEYDKPILDHLKNPEVAEQMRTALRSFYDVFKYLDEYLCFVFITGVSKFTQTSLFSGLNNLNDLSGHPKAATVCGYTKAELSENFQEHLEVMAKSRKSSVANLIQEFETWYNGYSFTWGMPKIFNPFSVLSAFDLQEFENFWMRTGTPNFLATMFKNQNPVPQLDQHLRVKKDDLVIVDLEKLSLIPMLVQTGYLTIVGQDEDGCIIDFPNQEVSRSYMLWGLAGTFSKESTDIRSLGIILRKALKKQDFDAFFNQLIPMFASIPFDIQVGDREKYYQSIIYLLFLLVGIDMGVEISTNIGSIDALIKTDDAIIIFEYKLRDTAQAAQAALDQIKDKKYYERFLQSGKKIILVGVQFSMQERNIVSWLVDECGINSSMDPRSSRG